MRAMDEKGRLFGRISVIDILAIIAVVAFAAGFVYRRVSGDIKQIIDANASFYVTFRGDQLRDFSLNAVDEGDVFFKQYDGRPLGKVVRMDVTPGTDIMIRTDGTAAVAKAEGRNTLYLTVLCTGSVTDTGYFVNGYQQVAAGNEWMIQSNRLLINTIVHRVSETEYAPE